MIAIFGCTCKANIQISQAKSEALDDIYSLLKQNIKWCNAKRRRQRRRTAKNKQTNKQTKGLISQKKNNFARETHFFWTFLCRCFIRLQRETCRNFYVFSITFFHCRSLLWWPQHFSFCHRRYKIFMLFFQQKMSPLFFISRSRSLSPFFSLSFAGLPPTLSFALSFSCATFQICGHNN